MDAGVSAIIVRARGRKRPIRAEKDSPDVSGAHGVLLWPCSELAEVTELTPEKADVDGEWNDELAYEDEA